MNDSLYCLDHTIIVLCSCFALPKKGNPHCPRGVPGIPAKSRSRIPTRLEGSDNGISVKFLLFEHDHHVAVES